MNTQAGIIGARTVLPPVWSCPGFAMRIRPRRWHEHRSWLGERSPTGPIGVWLSRREVNKSPHQDVYSGGASEEATRGRPSPRPRGLSGYGETSPRRGYGGGSSRTGGSEKDCFSPAPALRVRLGAAAHGAVRDYLRPGQLHRAVVEVPPGEPHPTNCPHLTNCDVYPTDVDFTPWFRGEVNGWRTTCRVDEYSTLPATRKGLSVP